MAQSALFTGLASNWDSAISTGITQTVSASITANATLLTSLLTLHLIISGVLTMYGRLSMSEWVFTATRAAIIGTLLTVAAFNQYIQQPLMTDIPNWIAQSVNGNLGAQTGAQQFDALRNGVVAIEASILQQATGFTQIGERIRADFATWLICLELTVTFIIWEMSRGVMGLLVATAPFLMGFYLFHTTRHIVLNLAGTAVSILIQLLMMSILLSITLNADQQWLNGARAANGAIDIELDNMKSIALFFLFGMVMTIFLPILAGRIGNGVLPGVGAIVRSPLSVGRTPRLPPRGK